MFALIVVAVVATVMNHSEALASCNASHSAIGSGDLILMQLHGDADKISGLLQSRATSSSNLSSHKVASQIRAYLAQPSNVGAALAAGITAVRTVLPFFTEEHPRLAKGLLVLGTKLFDAVSMIIPPDVKVSAQFTELQVAWDESLESLPSDETLAQDVKEFQQNGDVGAFVRVCNTVLKNMGAVVTYFLPEPVDAEVAKFIGALEDAVQGFDEGMVEFTSGNTTSAVRTIYQGVRIAASLLLPAELQEDASFGAVAGALDVVFGNLSSIVLQYQQQLLKSKTCWKSLAPREHRRPDTCPTGTSYDGKAWCSSSDSSLLEAAVARKGSSSGTSPTCSSDGDFPTQKGSWCYKDCPFGLEPFHTRCRSACVGLYPVDSPLMCGKSPGTIALAALHMGAASVRAALGVAAYVDSTGIAALGTLVMTLIGAGKNFVHPLCPT